MSSSCRKAPDPNMGLHPQASSNPISPKFPFLRPTHWGSGLPHAFWGDTDIQCMELGFVLLSRGSPIMPCCSAWHKLVQVAGSVSRPGLEPP